MPYTCSFTHYHGPYSLQYSMNKALSVYSKIMWDTVTDYPQKSLTHLGKETRLSKMSAHTTRKFLN